MTYENLTASGIQPILSYSTRGTEHIRSDVSEDPFWQNLPILLLFENLEIALNYLTAQLLSKFIHSDIELDYNCFKKSVRHKQVLIYIIIERW